MSMSSLTARARIQLWRDARDRGFGEGLSMRDPLEAISPPE
jgi:hypothetical protein